MANTYKWRWLKVITQIAEESDKPAIKLEAIKLGLLIKAEENAAKAGRLDPAIAEALGLKPKD
jgi:hypothetical protein